MLKEYIISNVRPSEKIIVTKVVKKTARLTLKRNVATNHINN